MVKIVNGPTLIRFVVNKRPNIHAPKGHEWALDATMGGDWWTYITYNKKPSERQIRHDKELILRTMEIYHSHMFVPNFKVREDDEY